MLKEAVKVQCNLRTVVESVSFDDAAGAHFDLAIGAGVGTLLDPSDSLSAWYGKDGPQNYSFWDSKGLPALTARIDREIDPAKRLQLVHQAEAIMKQDPPLLPEAGERINEIWYNRVKGLNPAPISASLTSCVWIRSGSTSRELRRVRLVHLRVR
jgi:ABC-type transport system substrate-binding protein